MGRDARFGTWSAAFLLEAEDDLVDQPQLDLWLAIAGRRVGLGDGRPEKSGDFGRFVVGEIERVKSSTDRGMAGLGTA